MNEYEEIAKYRELLAWIHFQLLQGGNRGEILDTIEEALYGKE